MPTISILPDLLINKIAAGEVIERPASVVRELIDNSIDAGARSISVEILHGGKKLIKVADDGAGMDRDDASLCFERHATSKIHTESNLFNITTLGFRGEALSSVASVSKITLITSPKDSATGSKVELGINHKKEITDAPAVRGTTVEVRDIFYNTPARRKFLKSTPTELSHIIETVIQKAFAYPGISFSLVHNNSEVLHATATDSYKERFLQLYGEELTTEFFEVEKGEGVVKLYGFCSTPAFTRATRNYQIVFVNRRAVRNPTVSHAVYSAYRDIIPKDRHPAFFLFLDIDPHKVDVNVHPAKREVRFETPDRIHTVVAHAIREVLKHGHGTEETAHAPASRLEGWERPEEQGAGLQSPRTVKEAFESVFQVSEGTQADFFDNRIAPAIRKFFYIGEAFVAEATQDGLAILDRHAIHERVLYEKLLKKIPLEVENLFLPIRVELPAKEYIVVMSHKELFHDFGLDIEEFGANNIIVRALPKEMKKADVKGMLMDAASNIMEQEQIGIKGDVGKEKLLQNVAASLACHRSVRGKEHLGDEEMNRLIADLEKTEFPDKCPHGRPTRIVLSLDDLRKMFKRK
jgi:DNA mismatch repair protein MutL